MAEVVFTSLPPMPDNLNKAQDFLEDLDALSGTGQSQGACMHFVKEPTFTDSMLIRITIFTMCSDLYLFKLCLMTNYDHSLSLS